MITKMNENIKLYIYTLRLKLKFNKKLIVINNLIYIPVIKSFHKFKNK